MDGPPTGRPIVTELERNFHSSLDSSFCWFRFAALYRACSFFYDNRFFSTMSYQIGLALDDGSDSEINDWAALEFVEST
jgi:hypothetical protein